MLIVNSESQFVVLVKNQVIRTVHLYAHLYSSLWRSQPQFSPPDLFAHFLQLCLLAHHISR